jgi:hypothetical protein
MMLRHAIARQHPKWPQYVWHAGSASENGRCYRCERKQRVRVNDIKRRNVIFKPPTETNRNLEKDRRPWKIPPRRERGSYRLTTPHRQRAVIPIVIRRSSCDFDAAC